MEYLFHRHSDLYAGAKGQRRIGGRKTAARVQSPASSRGGELNRRRGFKKNRGRGLIQWRRADRRDAPLFSLVVGGEGEDGNSVWKNREMGGWG